MLWPPMLKPLLRLLLGLAGREPGLAGREPADNNASCEVIYSSEATSYRRSGLSSSRDKFDGLFVVAGL